MMAAYEAAWQSAAWIPRGDRRVVRVFGRDPVRMVQGLVSNDVTRAGDTRAVYAAVLTPKGKMVCDVRVLRHGDDVLLETAAAAADTLIAHLKKFVPPLFARFEDAAAEWAVLGVYGPSARALIGQALGVTLRTDMAEDDAQATSLDDAPVTFVATSYTSRGGYDIIAPPSAIARVAERLVNADAPRLDDAALDVLRIEAGQPRWGVDIDENTIPLEAHLRARAISETKGCYTGQEVIVRILHRGHVNWLLRGVLLGDGDPPAPGAALLHTSDYRKIGRVTSAVRSPRHDATIALGFVRHELKMPAEAHLESATGPRVRLVELPFPEP